MNKPRITLTRPLVFFDLETTGVDEKVDRIVQIGIIKYDTDWNIVREINKLVNPEMPIPESSTEVHGITNEMVKDAPTFEELAMGISRLMTGADIGGFNSNKFDVPFLNKEFNRVGIVHDFSQSHLLDVGNIFKITNPRTLVAAAQFYCGVDLTDAHDAMADTKATAEVFLAQLQKHEEIPDTIEEAALFSNYGKPILDLSGKFTTDDDGDIVFTFGPNRGLKAKDHLDFVGWMLTKDFNQDTLEICNKLFYGSREF